MNETTRFYDENADKYYNDTINADVSDLMKRFLAYLPQGGTIVDAGCGSGRDVKAFCDMGFDATGIDSSKELIKLAKDKLGIEARLQDMSNWEADEPVDGIWCCASLMHLSDDDIRLFLLNTKDNLSNEGAIFISIKTGVETGIDKEGRFVRNFTENELRQFIHEAKYLEIKECWDTEDALSREDFRWINVIAVKKV